MASEPKDKGITLERILQAAQNEFSTKGFDGASIEHIAREANVTKQLIYHYFQTKDQLYKMTLESVAGGMAIMLDPDDYRAISALDALTLIVNRVIDEYIKNPSYAALTLDQGLHHGAHITERSRFIPNTRRFIDEIVKPILERGVAAGELRTGLDAGIVYWMIFHSASGCFHNAKVMSQTTHIDFNTDAGIALWRAAAIDFIVHACAATPR
jgi:AcrR family transcriptional regulator